MRCNIACRISFVLALSLPLIASPPAHAQAHTQSFRVGDRIDVDPFSMHGSYKKWYSAHIVSIVQSGGRVTGYVIKIDPGNNNAGQEYNVGATSDYVRPSSAAAPQAAEIGQAPTQQPAAAQAAPAQAGGVACPASNPGPAASRVEQAFRAATVNKNAREAEPGSDGKVTVIIQSFVLGAPRAWKLEEAYTDADPKRPIYPVDLTFTTCTDYQTRVVLFKRITAENCYTNQAGAPECNEIATAGYQEQTRSINK